MENLKVSNSKIIKFFIIVFLTIHFVKKANCENDITELTSWNFKHTIKKYPYVVVNFYNPECKICKALNPLYSAVAQKLAELKSEIKLAKIDAIKQRKIANSYQVKGYPTLIFFKNGEAIELYGGIRKPSAIVLWLLSKAINNHPTDNRPTKLVLAFLQRLTFFLQRVLED